MKDAFTISSLSSSPFSADHSRTVFGSMHDPIGWAGALPWDGCGVELLRFSDGRLLLTRKEYCRPTKSGRTLSRAGTRLSAVKAAWPPEIFPFPFNIWNTLTYKIISVSYDFAIKSGGIWKFARCVLSPPSPPPRKELLCSSTFLLGLLGHSFS